MNSTVYILAIEIALVLFLIVAFLLFFAWKRKKSRTHEFEQLLQNVTELQVERKAQLQQLLMNNYALGEEEASENSSYMLEAEKQFLQQFITQQIEQTPVTDFYQQLCGMLDQYIYFIPAVEQGNAGFAEQAIADKENKTVSANEISEIENREEFAEADSDARLEDSPATGEKITEEEELDWGAAFAESGDTMDEEAKKGYEAGLENK